MYEDFAPKLAKVITEYSTPIRKGDFVVITGNTECLPLVEALYEAVLRRGGNPSTMISVPGLHELYMSVADEEQLRFISPISSLVYEKADVLLNIEAPINTKSLSDIDPARIAITQAATAAKFQDFLKRIGDGSLRWCLLPWPTHAAAMQTEMGIHGYREFLYKACGLHYDDPIAYWSEVRDKQTRLAEFLADKHRAEVKGPGIDLSFEFGGRLWVSCHGELNFPDGEIFTGPIEDSVNGTVEFNMASIFDGHEVQGIKFKYVDGVIVEASAEKGEDYLMSQLDLDEGARRLGEFAIGTNFGVTRVTGSILLDEKIGGTIHMAIGNSIPQSLGQNVSRVHWDMVHDMKDGGEIYIDGELFYRAGEFLV